MTPEAAEETEGAEAIPVEAASEEVAPVVAEAAEVVAQAPAEAVPEEAPLAQAEVAPEVAEEGAPATPQKRTRKRAAKAETKVGEDPEGIAAEGGHDAPDDLATGDADANLVATAADAMGGDIPPAADESRLGVHPDAAE